MLTFYNNAKFVESALAQLRALADQRIQLVVVDDGSTDGTAEALADRSEEGWYTYIRNDANRGIAWSRNRAVRECRGEYIWFADCDDQWSPDIVERLLQAAEISHADVVVCRARRTRNPERPGGTLVDGLNEEAIADGLRLAALLLTGRVRGYLWTKAIRRELLIAHPFPPLSSQSDLAAVLEIAFAGARFHFVPDLLYTHVERMGSITNSRILSLDNLTYCWRRVHELVKRHGWESELADQLAFFDQWFYRTSAVNTTIRLGAGRSALQAAEAARNSITLRQIRGVSRFSRRAALTAALMRYGGFLYPWIYRAYLRASNG
ncbi:glycosyltransferase family 2 protein [Blastococcus sp. SYSU DS0617]